jgi:serine/threonine protein kinase
MPADAHRVQAIFLRAIEAADPATRAQVLQNECGVDAELRERVEALLRGHDASGGFLDKPPVSPISTVDEPRLTEGPGTRIGPYKLLQQLGEGGMGVVFMAEQVEPVHRNVALKVIKPGMDTQQVVARFEVERQALALMDHPNIAKVLDAGATDSGRPYFVMELVKGLPITNYCDQEHLLPRERLELFVSVCQAVQHAHQKGIIHRDLKPSNILIALYDGRPVPKVIDFGVAKATIAKLTDRTLFTEVGHAIGTWEYMAPEQAELNNLDIDTRADIYALGATLYELLAGSPPFTKAQLRSAAFEEMLRLIREVEPPRPSTKLSSSEELPSLAAKRKLEPAKLSRLVRGDLDWIVMKCLEKERGRRYETANQLAEEVRRFLADEPVQAGPPSLRYRAGKFLRRHRGPVLAGALVAFALITGIIGTSYGMWRASNEAYAKGQALIREHDALKKEKERADSEGRALSAEKLANAKERAALLEEERERKFAQAISAFVKDDFLALTSVEGQQRFGGPQEDGLNKDTGLRELLDRAAEKLRSRKDLEPRIEAELCWIIGVNYRGIGEAAKGVPFLERAVALRKHDLGVEHKETLNAQNSLAVCYEAAGRLDLALPLYEETFKLMKAKLGPDHPYTLSCMESLAMGDLAAGKLDLGLPLLEETLKLMKAKRGPNNLYTLVSMKNLALGYRDVGKLDLAQPLCEETLKLMKAKLGPDHSCTLSSMHALGMCYHSAGKLDLALPLYEEALKLIKAKLGFDHPHTLASMNSLARGYRDAGKLDLAVPLSEETLKLRKAKLGPDHPDTLVSMDNLASCYRDAGKLDLALPLSEETLKLRKAKLGPDHPDTLSSITNLAMCYQAAGKLDLALPLYEETLKLRKAKLGPDHPDTLVSMNNLAWGYQSARKLDLALPLFESAALGVEKRMFVHEYAHLIIPNTFRAYEAARQLAKAEVWRRKWLAVVKDKQETQPGTYLAALEGLGLNLLGQKRYQDAEPVLKEAYAGIKGREKSLPLKRRAELPKLADNLLQIYQATGNKGEAEKWSKIAVEYRRAPLEARTLQAGTKLLPKGVAFEVTEWLRDAEFEKACQKMTEQGYRTAKYHHYVNYGRLGIAILWLKDSQTNYYWFGGLKFVSNKVSEGRKNGLRPVDLSGVWLSEKSRQFSCVLEPDQGLKWQEHYSLTMKELTELLDQERSRGWRADVLSAVVESKEPQFMAVFVENPKKLEWEFDKDLTPEAYDLALETRAMAGWWPKDIAVYPAESEFRYAVLWMKKP